MKLSLSCVALIATSAYSLPTSNGTANGTAPDYENEFGWKGPGPQDFRGPCPMMNTLANHGFLPRDGRNITKDNAVFALGTALNFAKDLATIMWEQALIANPEPNATFFTLDNLNRHNVLEHDASMSRLDAHFGNNHIFNERVFQETTKYWVKPVLDAQQLSNGKLARMLQSKAGNPDYKFTQTTEAFSLGEVAAPIIVFGDMEAGTVRRDIVESFFRQEKFPTQLGFNRQPEVVTLEQILEMSELIGNASTLFTDGGEAAPHQKRFQNLHGLTIFK